VIASGSTPAGGPFEKLTEETLAQGVRTLSQGDPDLARVVARIGPPPLWARAPGFPTLIHIILEQQVSLASAKAAFDRLQAAISPVTPEAFLSLDGETLKRIGFSRQKSAYGRGLAEQILLGRLDLEALEGLADEAARAALLGVKGIGPWTADIYLLMALRRPDIWPSGDLALAVAVQAVKGLNSRPGAGDLDEIAQAWRPWRAVAARLLWHHYLNP
jgi:DNA-3-methyladenine glycosylase II